METNLGARLSNQSPFSCLTLGFLCWNAELANHSAQGDHFQSAPPFHVSDLEIAQEMIGLLDGKAARPQVRFNRVLRDGPHELMRLEPTVLTDQPKEGIDEVQKHKYREWGWGY